MRVGREGAKERDGRGEEVGEREEERGGRFSGGGLWAFSSRSMGRVRGVPEAVVPALVLVRFLKVERGVERGVQVVHTA